MLFLDKPRTLDLMIAHAEHICVPAPFAAGGIATRSRPSLLQGPPLPVVWPAAPIPAAHAAPAPIVPAAVTAPPPPPAPRPASAPRTPVPAGARGWTAA